MSLEEQKVDKEWLEKEKKMNNQIYVGWWGYEDGLHYEDIKKIVNYNHEARKKLKSKYKILCCDKRQPTKEELENNELIYVFLGGNRYQREYQVVKKPTDITKDEIALIIDSDLLPYGYIEVKNTFYIYQD